MPNRYVTLIDYLSGMPVIRKKQICKLCKSQMTGRSDKLFCSANCRVLYHRKLRAATEQATTRIDKILHRNRSILLELMGKYQKQINIDGQLLDQKKFNYKYFTSRTVNKQGKTYLHIYDFRYMLFSDHTVLIVRK